MKIARDEEGQTLVFVAVCLVVLLGFVALATDVGLMLQQRRYAQTVADAAAIAAASESLNEANPGNVTAGIWSAASQDATLAGFTPGTSNGAANSRGSTLTIKLSPNIGVSGFNNAGYAQAVVSLNTPTFFMNLFGFHATNVSATAIAANSLESDGCFNVQGDNGLANPAATMNGSSYLWGQNCGVTVNGNVTMGGSSEINAKFITASGTITNGGSSSITGPVSQNAPPTPDPLANKLQNNEPTAASCATGTVNGMACFYNFNGGNLTGQLQPGIYYFDNNVTTTCGNGNSAVPCVQASGTVSQVNGGTAGTAGVTLFLANNLSLDFNNNGSFNLYPPGYGTKCTDPTNPASSNPFCGILIDAPTDGSGGGSNGTYTCSSGNGNNKGNPGELYFDFGSSETDLEGIVYAPYMQLFVQDQGASTTLDTDIVIGNFCAQAATISITGYNGNYSPLTRSGLVY